MKGAGHSRYHSQDRAEHPSDIHGNRAALLVRPPLPVHQHARCALMGEHALRRPGAVAPGVLGRRRPGATLLKTRDPLEPDKPARVLGLVRQLLLLRAVPRKLLAYDELDERPLTLLYRYRAVRRLAGDKYRRVVGPAAHAVKLGLMFSRMCVSPFGLGPKCRLKRGGRRLRLRLLKRRGVHARDGPGRRLEPEPLPAPRARGRLDPRRDAGVRAALHAPPRPSPSPFPFPFPSRWLGRLLLALVLVLLDDDARRRGLGCYARADAGAVPGLLSSGSADRRCGRGRGRYEAHRRARFPFPFPFWFRGVQLVRKLTRTGQGPTVVL
ncbi:hypothetical protein FIBSPDRAFT_964278, partial [Athelia psychrophila]